MGQPSLPFAFNQGNMQNFLFPGLQQFASDPMISQLGIAQAQGQQPMAGGWQQPNSNTWAQQKPQQGANSNAPSNNIQRAEAFGQQKKSKLGKKAALNELIDAISTTNAKAAIEVLQQLDGHVTEYVLENLSVGQFGALVRLLPDNRVSSLVRSIYITSAAAFFAKLAQPEIDAALRRMNDPETAEDLWKWIRVERGEIKTKTGKNNLVKPFSKKLRQFARRRDEKIISYYLKRLGRDDSFCLLNDVGAGKLRTAFEALTGKSLSGLLSRFDRQDAAWLLCRVQGMDVGAVQRILQKMEQAPGSKNKDLAKKMRSMTKQFLCPRWENNCSFVDG